MSKQSDQRLRLIMFVFAAAFAVVIGRALYVQILQASALAARAHGQQNSTIVVPTSRGRILDATGKTLAVDVPAKDLMVDPSKVQDPGQVASYIAQKLGYQIKHKKAFKKEVRFLVGRLTAPHVVQAVVLSQLDPAVAAEIMSAHPPGLFTLDSVRRDYPSGKLASQLIGYVDYNNSGTLGSGIENEYNSVLGGHPGEQLEVRGPGGVPLSTVTLRRAQQGRDVQLTIDRSIQQKVQSVLDATVSRTGAHSATALVLDPRNGSILAMATAPGYDNNDVHALIAKQGAGDTHNMAVEYSYEPGSTFKVVTMGAALTAGIVTPQTQFRIPYAIKVGDRIVHDDAVRPTRTFTAAQILQQSSNVGTVTIAELVHKQPLYDWIRRWGFGSPTHIGLPAEASGAVMPPDKWYSSSIGNIPIGQGICGHAAADGGHVLGHRQRRRDDRAARGGEDRRPPGAEAGLAADPEPDRRPHPREHAEGRRRYRRRHRHPRVGAGLHRGRQDRYRAGGAAPQPRLLDPQLRGLVRRLPAGRQPAGRGAGGGQLAAHQHLRRHRGGPRLPADRRVPDQGSGDPARQATRPPGQLTSPPGLELANLIGTIGPLEVRGGATGQITALTYDAAAAVPGALHFCVPGFRVDGHDFAGQAEAAGAVALVVERFLDIDLPQLLVRSSRAAMGPAADTFYGHPSHELDVIGVTGTNGKTTTCFLMYSVLEAAGLRPALLGTVESRIGGRVSEVKHTTPESIDLQAQFRQMADAGDQSCAMEVSSHALALDRVAGTRFAAAAFTNLTQDHLDFHPTMEEYYLAKRRLFENEAWPAAVNVADPYGRRLVMEAAGPVLSYAADDDRAAVRPQTVEIGAGGAISLIALTPRGLLPLDVRLRGDFNVSNVLCVVALSELLELPHEAVRAGIAALHGVPGRFEPVDAGQPFTVLVDYAHTPDSLENVLTAARRITSGDVICVFGCGGDRDRGKRRLMGGVARRLADRAIVTNDNPRSEDPAAIAAEIMNGIDMEVELDRRRAIELAVAAARPGDIVVIAGKGHEQGQQFADHTVPFDDRTAALEALQQLGPTA